MQMSVMVMVVVIVNLDKRLAAADSPLCNACDLQIVMSEMTLGQFASERFHAQSSVHERSQYHVATAPAKQSKYRFSCVACLSGPTQAADPFNHRGTEVTEKTSSLTPLCALWLCG